MKGSDTRYFIAESTHLRRSIPVAGIIAFVFSVFFLSTGLAAQVIQENAMVAYLPFDGNAVDHSGYGNDGTVFGAKLTSDRLGNPNSAYKFNGISDYIQVDDALELRGGTDPISVAAWFKPNSVDSLLRPIVTKYLDSASKDWGIRIKNGALNFSSERQQDDYDCADTLNTLGTEQWYLAVFVAEEPNLTLYLDGVEVNKCADFISHWTSTEASVEIGRIGYNSAYFSGLIDDVRIYNYALSAAEVMQLYTGTQTAVTSSNASVPEDFTLEQNYPNPFNPTTQIRFDLPHASPVKINIYNTAGQQIRGLVSRSFHAGRHSVIWNGRDDGGREAASGIYVYSIDAAEFAATRKMVKLK